mgnify:CR=1 FL=1
MTNSTNDHSSGQKSLLWGMLGTVSSAMLLGTANFLFQTSMQLSVLQEQVRIVSNQIQQHENRIHELEIQKQGNNR